METKLISEIEYLKFKNGLRSIIISIIAGFVIGAVIGWFAMDGNAVGIIVLGMMFAGMPYGWKSIPVFAFGWITIIIKFIAAVCLGWIITPVSLVYHFIQMKRYEKAVQAHLERGEN